MCRIWQPPRNSIFVRSKLLLQVISLWLIFTLRIDVYALRDLMGHCYVHFAFLFTLINDVTRPTLLARACACSYKNLPRHHFYRVSNTALLISSLRKSTCSFVINKWKWTRTSIIFGNSHVSEKWKSMIFFHFIALFVCLFSLIDKLYDVYTLLV